MTFGGWRARHIRPASVCVTSARRSDATPSLPCLAIGWPAAPSSPATECQVALLCGISLKQKTAGAEPFGLGGYDPGTPANPKKGTKKDTPYVSRCVCYHMLQYSRKVLVKRCKTPFRGILFYGNATVLTTDTHYTPFTIHTGVEKLKCIIWHGREKCKKKITGCVYAYSTARFHYIKPARNPKPPSRIMFDEMPISTTSNFSAER
mgnify:CR=1 FL=1